jgi:hypothetical protein
VIRRADEADLDQCIALAALAATERSADAWRDALRRDAEHPERLLVVAESNGAIVGMDELASSSPALTPRRTRPPAGTTSPASSSLTKNAAKAPPLR